MKKLNLITLAVLLAAMLVGCGNSTPKADLQSDIDTLSYTFGLAQTKGLKEYLVGRMGVDTAYMSQFEKGVRAGMNTADDKKKAAYNAGMQIGMQISGQMMPGINNEIFGDDTTKSISMKNFMAGFLGGLHGDKTMVSQDEAMGLFRVKMEEVKQRVIDERYGPNKLAGENFLKEIAKQEGIKKLPSGVMYRVIKEGNGALPVDTSQVEVNYEGRLINDTVFDSSYKRGVPSKFRVNRVIPGWSEALKQMPVGSEWEIYIPQDMAYGSRKQAKIDPYSALVFKVELVDIAK